MNRMKKIINLALLGALGLMPTLASAMGADARHQARRDQNDPVTEEKLKSVFNAAANFYGGLAEVGVEALREDAREAAAEDAAANIFQTAAEFYRGIAEVGVEALREDAKKNRQGN